MTFERFNQKTPEAQEYDSLVRKLFNNNEKLINRVSEKTNKTTNQVREIINKAMTKHDVRKMVENKTQHKQTDNLQRLRNELNSFKYEDIKSDDGSISLLLIPDYLIEVIAEDSIDNIHERLHERADQINQLVISDQELRELRGVLNPAGDSETKIDSLDKMADSYRLKALGETDKHNETLYEIVSRIA